jgi:hypothetical protein
VAHSLLRRNTAPATILHTTPCHTSSAHCTSTVSARDAVRCRMLCLSSCWQPTTAGNALCIKQSLEYIFSNNKQMLNSSETTVLFCRAAVNVRSTTRIVLDDGGSNFARRSRTVAYHVEETIRAVYSPGVRFHRVNNQFLPHMSLRTWKQTYTALLLAWIPKNLRCPCPSCGAVSDLLSAPGSDLRTRCSCHVSCP